MNVCELVFTQSGGETLHVRVDRAETCLGPHPTNDVIVPDDNLPDVAAVLVHHGAERYGLRSLAPTMTRVNNSEMVDDEVQLRDQDQLQIGAYNLIFRLQTEDTFAGGQTKIQDAEEKSSRRAQISVGQRSFQIDPEQPFNIGSADDNNLVVPEDFVSAYHCRISERNGHWMLVDLGSTNGTEVNGLKIVETELPKKAAIRLGGNTSLDFSIHESRSDHQTQQYHGMSASDPKMIKVFRLIEKFANIEAPVLITGNSGCGKELVARALHDASRRHSKHYLALNCGALAADVIEGELFGHVKGAFTGAVSDKAGAFEAAQNGTIFLDEIGELPLPLQPKLLRVLEAKTIRRVGGTREIAVNTRIVAATHRDLMQLVREGRFREDLFHRLFVLNIAIPPLLERPGEILDLAELFLQQQAPDRALALSDMACERLLHYKWPGNVRELKNMMLRAVLMAEHDLIGVDDLEFSGNEFFSQTAAQRVRDVDGDERKEIIKLLKLHSGNRSKVARILGLSRSTFHDKLKRLGVPKKFN